jgi:hypothetical protein
MVYDRSLPVKNPEIKMVATRIKEGMLKVRLGGASYIPRAAGRKQPNVKTRPVNKIAAGIQGSVLFLCAMNEPNQIEARNVPRSPAIFSGIIKILEMYVRNADMAISKIPIIPGYD